jgi:hypothetical protein
VAERIQQTPVFRDPIVYIGDQAPDPAESEDLWRAIEVLSQQGPRVGIPALELFAQTYSNSVWTPSLQNNLGFNYRNRGGYTLALQYWGSAWDATKLAESGRAKEVADFALAHLTRLLANLGWSEELEAMLQETWWRVLDAGPLEQIFELTKESFVGARNEPQAAYRCGAQALSRVAGVLQPGNFSIPYLPEIPSPQAGFSLSALKALANQAGLNLVAVQRVRGQELIVPAVVHWRVDHYAAITARDGNWYKVEDTALDQPIWMDMDTINAEASGYFLIPINQQRPDWAPLSQPRLIKSSVAVRSSLSCFPMALTMTTPKHARRTRMATTTRMRAIRPPKWTRATRLRTVRLATIPADQTTTDATTPVVRAAD